VADDGVGDLPPIDVVRSVFDRPPDLFDLFSPHVISAVIRFNSLAWSEI
jgi:hypothetical protein